MKKLALAVIATAFIAISHSPASAQTPIAPVPDDRLVECGESDGRVDTPPSDGIADSCTEFYVAALPPVIEQVPPTVAPTTTVPLATGPLPRTGSGVSPLLGAGAALLVGGGIIVVATRRRTTATAA